MALWLNGSVPCCDRTASLPPERQKTGAWVLSRTLRSMRRLGCGQNIHVNHFVTINDLRPYRIAFPLTNALWQEVCTWDAFSRMTIGAQFVRAVDSITANLAEGFARYHKRDKIKFYYYALGSVGESVDWNEKALQRKLLDEDRHRYFRDILHSLPREIHATIRMTMEKLSI